jgi:hypothetical protein
MLGQKIFTFENTLKLVENNLGRPLTLCERDTVKRSFKDYNAGVRIYYHDESFDECAEQYMFF